MRSCVKALLAIALCAPARAEKLKVDWAVDGFVTGAGAVTWILSETVFKRSLGRDECLWCDPSLNAVDREIRTALRWSDSQTADYVSNVTGFMLAPGSALGLIGIVAERDGQRRHWAEDALIVAQSAVIAGNLNQLAKLTIGRQRPFVRYRIPDPRLVAVEDNMSFYSGHASLSFSLAVSSGTIASTRGYRGAPVVWAIGLAAAAGTGYLRIAGDRHYFTDVLAGAAMGSLVGFVVPYVFHRGRGDTRLLVTPTAVALSGTW